MKQNIKELEINGMTYVPKESIKSEMINTEGLKTVIVRTYSAGVFYGFLNKMDMDMDLDLEMDKYLKADIL